jgi:uncharacterized membrane protein
MKDTKKITLYTTRAAVIAALYVILTELATLVGMSSGVIQFRISEALCILPLFLPEAIPGLFIGCIISNLLVPGIVIWDIIFGSLATLIAAVATRKLINLPEKYKWAATIPCILSNMIIVPFVLIFAYGAPDSYLFLMLTVGIGEIVCAGCGGSALYYILRKHTKSWLK